MKLATLCYLRHDGQTLMLHRVKKKNDIHQDKWNGLGGKIDIGESPEECVVREVREESGLTVLDPFLEGVLTFPNFSHDEDWYVFVFTATKYEGELIDSDEGRLQWIDNQRLVDLNLWAGDRLFFRWMERPGFFSGKLVYEDGELTGQSVSFYNR